MRTAWIAPALLLSAACNQSARPGPEAASTTPPAVTTPSEIETTAPPAETAAAPGTETATPPGSAPGDVALPPGSAKPWNNAQSDGNAPTGDRSLDDYRKIIQDNRDKFRRCYEVSLKAHPGIKGNVTLKFILTPKGEVKEAFIDKSASEITEADLETCMVAVLKTLSFPPSKRGMESTVRYPFNFNPHSSSASSR
jgi:TonB family protein